MSRGPGQPLDPKIKQRVAEVIGAGLTQVEAAGAVGISESSVERIMREPEYRKVADDIRARRTSMGAQAAEVVRKLLTAVHADGTPDQALRARGAEMYARSPALLDAADDFPEDTMLPGVVLRFPHPKIPNPDAPVTFSEAHLAPVE